MFYLSVHNIDYTMSRFIFLHDGYKTTLFEHENTYETLNEYRTYFTKTYPCLSEWNSRMNWFMETNQEDHMVEIHCETKCEGYTTLCIRNTENEYTLQFPFPPYMTYYQLRTIFSLLLPNTEINIYLKKQDIYYKPKHEFIFLPGQCTEYTVDTNHYPLLISTTLPEVVQSHG